MNFLKRRMFFKGSAGVLFGQALASNAAGQTSGGRPIQRTSALFPTSSATIQQVLHYQDLIITLLRDASSNVWSVAAATVDGKHLWRFRLPAGVYVGLGTIGRSGPILVHALYVGERGRQGVRNCVVRLNTTTGEARVIGTTDATGTNGRLHFAGDGTFIRVANEQVEIWDVSGSPRLHTTVARARRRPPEDRTPQTNGLKPTPARSLADESVHVDVLGAIGAVVLTQKDGTGVATVSIPGGTVHEFAVGTPEVTQAQALNERTIARSGLDPSKVATSVVLPVTGGGPDRVYAMVFPVTDGLTVPIITIDSAGRSSASSACELLKRQDGTIGMPLKLVVTDTEMGVVYSDGTLGWYRS